MRYNKFHFKFYQVRHIINDMFRKGIDKTQFSVRIRNHEFKGLLTIEQNCQTPYKLVIVKNYERKLFVLSLDLDNYYESDVEIDFWALCEILQIKSCGDGFGAMRFLRELDLALPTECQVVVRPSELVSYGLVDLSEDEDPDKIYFMRFYIHGLNSHVTETNLEKTYKLLGPKAYEICKNHNISTCWSRYPEDEHEINLLELLARLKKREIA